MTIDKHIISLLGDGSVDIASGSDSLDVQPALVKQKDRSGISFELRTMELIRMMGFEVATTKPTADGGIDLIAYSTSPIIKGKYIIQCKDWEQPVGASVVRDLYGTVHAEDANRGILIVSSNFTAEAIKFAEGKRLELINGDQLTKLENDYLKRDSNGKSNIPHKGLKRSFRFLLESINENNITEPLLIFGIKEDGIRVSFKISELRNLIIVGESSESRIKLIKTALVSQLVTSTPMSLRIIVVDMEKLSFQEFNGISNLLTSVISDRDKLVSVLRWTIAEIERRYQLLLNKKAKSISSYNESLEKDENAMPYIEVIMNDFNFLDREESSSLEYIAHMGNSVGVNVIFSVNSLVSNRFIKTILPDIQTKIGVSSISRNDQSILFGDVDLSELIATKALLKSNQEYKVSKILLAELSDESIVAFLRYISLSMPV